MVDHIQIRDGPQVENHWSRGIRKGITLTAWGGHVLKNEMMF